MDETRFAERAQLLRKRLYRTAYLYMGGEALAMDAVDEAVYKALLSCKRLRQEEFFDTWMTRILINCCKDMLKQPKRTIPLEELSEASVEQYDSLPLKDAVSRLPKELREPLILRYFGGMTTAEAAETLKLPQGTAATRIRRALQLLRLELVEEDT